MPFTRNFTAEPDSSAPGSGLADIANAGWRVQNGRLTGGSSAFTQNRCAITSGGYGALADGQFVATGSGDFLILDARRQSDGAGYGLTYQRNTIVRLERFAPGGQGDVLATGGGVAVADNVPVRVRLTLAGNVLRFDVTLESDPATVLSSGEFTDTGAPLGAGSWGVRGFNSEYRGLSLYTTSEIPGTSDPGGSGNAPTPGTISAVNVTDISFAVMLGSATPGNAPPSQITQSVHYSRTDPDFMPGDNNRIGQATGASPIDLLPNGVVGGVGDLTPASTVYVKARATDTTGNARTSPALPVVLRTARQASDRAWAFVGDSITYDGGGLVGKIGAAYERFAQIPRVLGVNVGVPGASALEWQAEGDFYGRALAQIQNARCDTLSILLGTNDTLESATGDQYKSRVGTLLRNLVRDCNTIRRAVLWAPFHARAANWQAAIHQTRLTTDYPNALLSLAAELSNEAAWAQTGVLLACDLPDLMHRDGVRIANRSVAEYDALFPDGVHPGTLGGDAMGVLCAYTAARGWGVLGLAAGANPDPNPNPVPIPSSGDVAEILARIRLLPPPILGRVVPSPVRTASDFCGVSVEGGGSGGAGGAPLPGGLARGFVRFTTGAARGAWLPILMQDASTNRFVLAEPLAGVPTVGDVFVVDGWR